MIDFGKQTSRIQFLALHNRRYGEASAMLDSHIYDGLVHINKSATGATKTVAGNRVVPLLSSLSFPRIREITEATGYFVVAIRSY